jgi:hypothetical protein
MEKSIPKDVVDQLVKITQLTEEKAKLLLAVESVGSNLQSISALFIITGIGKIGEIVLGVN